MTETPLVERFRAARTDPDLVVIEGFHALKHALRFGAEVVAAGGDLPELTRLARDLAPDVEGLLPELVTPVGVEVLEALAPAVPATPVVALARRPQVDWAGALTDRGPAPAVFLERPRHPGNAGAAIRVAAAAGAVAVLTSGSLDPWGPAAVRGAAGLQFALPVARLEGLPETGRAIVALDPEGDPLRPGAVPPRAVLAFGTERGGVSEELLERARARLRIPMREGVSSLNLATAVAATLYGPRAP